MLTVKNGDTIISRGQMGDTFYIIAEGSACAIAGGKRYDLKKGDIIGIFDLTLEEHICSYEATSDCTLFPYPYKDTNGLIAMMNKQEDLRKLLMSSLNRNIVNIINSYTEGYNICHELYKYIINIQSTYQALCQSLHLNAKALPFTDDLLSFTLDNELPFWMGDFYGNVRKIISDCNPAMSSNFVYGYLDRSGKDICHILELDQSMRESCDTFISYLMNEDYLDYYDLFTDLYFRAKSIGENGNDIRQVIDDITVKLTNSGLISGELLELRTKRFNDKAAMLVAPKAASSTDSAIEEELANSFNIIMDYADALPTTTAEFKKALDAFKQFPDKSSTDKEVDAVRRQVAKLFYIFYNDVMQTAIKDKSVPNIIKMFLNFGFVDAELCGHDNAVELYKLSDHYHGNHEQGIYTTLEWFKAIYNGEKQPSRSEFDQDYTQYVRTLSREGRITKDNEAVMLQDVNEKVLYELNNMFPSVNKITFGRIFTFCPVLLEENLIRNPESLLVTCEDIIDTMDKLTGIDYSAFYHEYIYEDTKVNVKETARVDIRPDVILMPNVGSKGILWQEIEGMNRKTPGRMVLSALYLENLDKAFIRMFGEYRWEMCKREQGARWNDVTVHSLTSDFSDYAQFFGKNHDLSVEAKEKIKETLKKCKNSYKELFINDYTLYMIFESQGSCRLNRVARSIIFHYCPLSTANREKAGSNTLFEECLSKHHIATAQALHRLDQIENKYHQAGKDLPRELKLQRDMISR